MPCRTPRATRASIRFLAAAMACAASAAPAAPRPAVVLHTAAETAMARAWITAKFHQIAPSPQDETGLLVLANNDPVQRNARGGQPMQIRDRRFARGLYCHAVSKVVVRLPEPARAFRATAGIDAHAGGGSIVFGVSAGGRSLYRSPTVSITDPGREVNVALGGASEFTLEVGDAGDGISCDQAVWGNARVTLAGGSTVWLGDLPILGARRPVTTDPPFSFVYGGKPSSELLRAWTAAGSTRKLDANRTARTLTWSEPGGGLSVRLDGIEYADYPTVEWTVRFRNEGASASEILENVQGLDIETDRGPETEFVLNHHTGTLVAASDFEPHRRTLGPGETVRFAPPGGRPLGAVFPYFNLERAGDGLIVVVGWPGQWAATFTRDSGTGMRIVAGQERTRIRLRPGEEIRTPLNVLQFWQGDRVRAQNVWRRWMLAHNLPRPGGRLPPAQMAACSSHQFGEMINANEQNQKLFVDRYLEERLPLDYWWMDAGWYPNQHGWPQTGTWEVDTRRFPRGLRAISDHAHTRGVRTIVWFEPERVAPDTMLYDQHPDWLLGRAGSQKLLDLGNPAARAWLTDHVDRLIREQGIDLYRQDYNVDPLGYWRSADAEDRQGATENHYITGYLAYWDELIRRHPNMLIDTCASGAHRNDLETLRRAVPLLRSDYILEPVGQQGHTYGLSSWMPYYGTGVNSIDPYVFRSQMCPHITACWDMRRRDYDYAAVRRLVGQWHGIGEMYFGDFYPLTPWSLAPETWIAWQFDRPERGDGMVQAFRRAESPYEVARFRLRMLEPAATYAVRDLDASAERKMTGRALMEDGLAVRAASQPGAVVIVYRMVGSAHGVGRR